MIPALPRLLCAALLTLGVTASAQEDWPGFRGTGGIGHAGKVSPPVSWSVKESRNILWKTPIERHGMSSPVVSSDRVFLTTADEKVRQLLCFDAATGKLLWHHDADAVPGADLPSVLEETGFAAPTPVVQSGRVAAIFATGQIICTDTSGKRLWAKNLGIPAIHYGFASSLQCHGDLVIVQYDQKEKGKVMAFLLKSGELAWETARSGMAWSSPIVVENGGRSELIVTSGESVDSYDPKTGKPLWRVKCLSGEVAPSAAYADGIVFVACEGSTAAAIDISRHDAEPKMLWQWDKSLPDASSPVAGHGFVIIPTTFGTVTCLEARTGKVCWEHEFPKGFNSSPILVNDRVYLIDTAGTMQIFKMAATFEPLGTADISEPAYASPAFSGDRIYLRGLSHLFCIGGQK